MSDTYKRLRNQVLSTTGCKVNDEAINIVLAWRGEQAARARGGEGVVPDGVQEALQRLIENGGQLGPASREDALLVAKHRDTLLSTPQPEGDGWKLPYDVVINGGMTFRKGVKLSTFVKAAERWHRDTMKQYAGISKEDIEALLHPTQPPKEGE